MGHKGLPARALVPQRPVPRHLRAEREEREGKEADSTLAATIREAAGLGCGFPDLGPWLAGTHWQAQLPCAHLVPQSCT